MKSFNNEKTQLNIECSILNGPYKGCASPSKFGYELLFHNVFVLHFWIFWK